MRQTDIVTRLHPDTQLLLLLTYDFRLTPGSSLFLLIDSLGKSPHLMYFNWTSSSCNVSRGTA